MSSVARNASLLVLFLLELAILAAAAYWGFTIGGGAAGRIVAGLGAPLLLAVTWGVSGAPRARVPARGLARAALEALWFGAGVAALAAAGATALAIVLAAVYLANAAVLRLWLKVPPGAPLAGPAGQAGQQDPGPLSR